MRDPGIVKNFPVIEQAVSLVMIIDSVYINILATNAPTSLNISLLKHILHYPPVWHAMKQWCAAAGNYQTFPALWLLISRQKYGYIFILRWYRAVLKRKITTRPAFPEWLLWWRVEHPLLHHTACSLVEWNCLHCGDIASPVHQCVTFMAWILAWHERKWAFSLFFFYSE